MTMEAKTLRARARANLAGNWGVSIGTTLVAALLGGLITGAGGGFNLELSEEIMYELPAGLLYLLAAYGSVASLLGFAAFIIGGVLQMGYAKFLLKQHDGEEVNFRDLFSQFDHFGTGFLQNLLRGLYIVLWTLLLIIPGIIKMLSYSMTPFILAENPNLTASQAIDLSKQMMEGHKMDLFILNLTFIGWYLLNTLTLGIGSLWLNPYVNASYAAFYRELQAQNKYTVYE